MLLNTSSYSAHSWLVSVLPSNLSCFVLLDTSTRSARCKIVSGSSLNILTFFVPVLLSFSPICRPNLLFMFHSPELLRISTFEYFIIAFLSVYQYPTFARRRYKSVLKGNWSLKKYWRLGRRHLGLSLTLWRHNVLKRFFWLLQETNKHRNREMNNQTPYSRHRVWQCDVTTSNSIQDGGAVVVNFGFRSSRAATALDASKKNITFCFNQG